MGPHCKVETATGELEDSKCGVPKCIWDVKCSAGVGTGYRGLTNSVTVDKETISCQVYIDSTFYYLT